MPLIDMPRSGEREREGDRDLEGDLVRLRRAGLADLRTPREPAELLLLLLRTGGDRDRLTDARLLPFVLLLPSALLERFAEGPESEDPEEEDEEPDGELESESDESESELESLEELLRELLRHHS